MRELGFSFPMALSAMGQMTSFAFSFILCDVVKAVPPADGVDMRFFLTRIAPVGAAQGVAMWLSNSLYLLLTVRDHSPSASQIHSQHGGAYSPSTNMCVTWQGRCTLPCPNRHALPRSG